MFQRLPDLYLTALAGFALLFALATSAQAARLVVAIQGIRSADGYVYVALFAKPEGFPDGNYSAQHKKIKAATEGLTVVFDDVSTGTYAVGAYHDENGNGRLDTNFFGYPTEGYALSNGIRAVITRPRFSDAAVLVGNVDAHITLDIKY